MKEIHDKFEEEIQKRLDIQEKNRHDQDMRMEILEKQSLYNKGKMKNLTLK